MASPPPAANLAVNVNDKTSHQQALQQPQSANAPLSVPRRIQPILTHLNQDGLKQVPSKFERCETDDLIQLIASMLDRLIAHNDRIPLTTSSLTRFHSRSPPSINITDYLRRMFRYTSVEPVCLLSILPYIDRICEKLASFTICSLTVHRFCITAVTVSSKSICDSFYANSRYAKVGGIGLAEMNLLEREFLIAIDYRLITTGEVLNRYYLSLVHSHPSYTLLSPESDPSMSASACLTAPHSTISALPPEPVDIPTERPIDTVDQQICDEKGPESNCQLDKVLVPIPIPDCTHDEEIG